MELRHYRHSLWKLAGFLDRQKHPAQQPKHRKRQAEEATIIDELSSEIRQLSPFLGLTEKQRKQFLKGDWRHPKGWQEVAVESGFSLAYYERVYSHLCSYSHSSYLSVLQMSQARDTEAQVQLGNTILDICTSCEKHRQLQERLIAAGWQDETEGPQQLMMFCVSRAFAYEDATAARQAGTLLADAKRLPSAVGPIQVQSEIRARIYDQVYGNHEFRSAPPKTARNAALTTCLLGPSFAVVDAAAVAKKIWGDNEVDRWLAGEAPSVNPATTPEGAPYASDLQSFYESVANQSLRNLDLLVSVVD